MKKIKFIIVLIVLFAFPIISVQADNCRDFSDDKCPRADSKGRICERDFVGNCYLSPVVEAYTCNLITDKDSCEKISRCDWTPDVGGCSANDSKSSRKSTGTRGTISDGKFRCSDVKYLSEAWLLIRIIAPFLIVMFGSLDLFKTITSGDEKEMKKLRSNLIKRVIAFVLLLVLPFLVQLLFSVMGTYGSNNVCLVRCIATHDTSNKGCD